MGKGSARLTLSCIGSQRFRRRRQRLRKTDGGRVKADAAHTEGAMGGGGGVCGALCARLNWSSTDLIRETHEFVTHSH